MSQDVNKELLPCPFCGGEAKIKQVPHKAYYWGECLVCTIGSDNGFANEVDAINAWNTRPQAQASGDEVERVAMAIWQIDSGNWGTWQYLTNQAKAAYYEMANNAIAAMNPPATQSVKHFLQGVDKEGLAKTLHFVRFRGLANWDFEKENQQSVVGECIKEVTAVIEHLIQLAGEK